MTPKVGDFVKVSSGPGYPGPYVPPVKGRVIQTIAHDGCDAKAGDFECIVKVASGGEWSFWAGDLTVMPKREKRG